jgi:hypothetical protein
MTDDAPDNLIREAQIFDAHLVDYLAALRLSSQTREHRIAAKQTLKALRELRTILETTKEVTA